ncbi:ATP-binding protein [Reinekea blandensis]|uniref:histidine kinase n=1 Tax=Reinekea blandensis MED297 TaxID=314283 RepID=A4BHP7_9GAMM|nr:ATP-binding protein [Reinekea blandensis]EAR08302.1 sensor histidine kinase [Reinekea sp. MED297] [Reinekea blandensis MED297]
MRRLWVKLFSVLVLANIAFALLLYWGFTLTFEIAFRNYLKEQEAQRFTPLATALAEIYQTEQSWQWVLSEHDRWRELMAEYIVRPGDTNRPDRPRPSSDNAPFNNPPPQNDDSTVQRPPPRSTFTRMRHGMNPHILLFDQDGNTVLGNMQSPDTIYRFPIEKDGQPLGEIGVRADSELLIAMQAVMDNHNNRRLLLIALGLLAVSSLLALGLTTWITRRIFRLKQGTSALVRGRYDHRLEVRGKDVLDSLGDDFNELADTLDTNRTAHRRWIASTSHELRTPVTILQGQIDALKDGIRPVTPTYLDDLSHDIHRLNALIDDLHQLSMSDVGALDYQKDDVDLVELVGDELAKLKTALPEGLTLSWYPPQDLDVFVLGDDRRLTQLINNLMQNSLRYTDVPGSISISLRVTKSQVTLIWEDSAPGVQEDDLSKLTQPLYRAESSRSRTVGGSGLGLAIVQTIVDAHNGQLLAEPSTLGGLKWTIHLQRVTSGL